MTNINCSEKCIYQQDGKCFLENIKNQKINSHSSCAYFTEIGKTSTCTTSHASSQN